MQRRKDAKGKNKENKEMHGENFNDPSLIVLYSF